jgi:3-isopropylmalate/(R)-2-methylmalate dehydratase large subunit
MGYTFAEKALARAAGLERAVAGQIVDARPDVAMSHDNTAAIAELFRSLGYGRVLHPEWLAIALDHAVPAPTVEHARNHREIRQFVAEQGIRHFYEAGRGICHQVISEEALAAPGQLVLGADSHTTHYGWLGAFGAGIGRSEMAAIWATGELWLRVPETIRVDFVGELPPGVMSKDLGLWTLKALGPEAGIYRALEFGGPGLRTLSVESRMVIPNLMAESGAKNAYLEPDEAVFEWLAQRIVRRQVMAKSALSGARRSWPGEVEGCECAASPWDEAISPQAGDCFGAAAPRNGSAAWIERLAAGALYPDPDAVYLERHTINLSALEPIVAAPHNPAKAVPLSQVAGTRIDQAFLGTCTNGRLEDLAAAAAILRGPDGEVRRVADGTRLVVIPASSEVLQQALALGYIQTFIAAGAMLGVPGCGPCMGNHLGIPASGETVISSGNRNFRGRMGNPEAAVYLANPAVVAASAVLGRIADPREVLGENGELQFADGRLQRANGRLQIANGKLQIAGSRSQLANGKAADGKAQMANGRSAHRPSEIRNPNSKLQTPNSQFTGRVWKYGDDVNTDVIFPGKYTYTVRDEAEMARHALEDLDPGFAAAVRPGDLIVAGRNWGAGSSREQAATCLKAAGVKAIVAVSFARIFFRNAINNSLLPIVCPEAVEAIQPAETITIDLERCVVRGAAGEFPFQPLSPSVRRIIQAGGLLEMLRAARV